MIFPERLKQLRQKKGLTQQEIANLVHVNRVTYTNWEKGNREPNFEKLFLLAEYLETTTDYLLGKSDSNKKRNYRDGEDGINYLLETLIVLFGKEGTLKKFNAENLDTVKAKIRQQFQELEQEGIKEISINPNPPILKSGNNSETTETE
ncbi:helix-turn-helix domain-containing protein [Streptococcus anginosus]|uniref:helix-turn-helix domain-containing protein n=1 Tax=Streptococcus anginosus TaxID=1328 RepID=UPI0023A9C588|nr:helix-turn-helix transcriptional regulator [Streptococcus anginosus]WEB04501.1 helix-turn-helix transcriptional regulator [Streptococcus anginosus]